MKPLGASVSPGIIPKIRFTLSSLFIFCALGMFAIIVYLIILGFPPEIGGYTLSLKNIRKPVLAFLTFFILSYAVHPHRQAKILNFNTKLRAFCENPYALWILFGSYSLLFLWQQVSEYYALRINFLPFSYYDYMPFFLFQGKINFTGWLHGYYHLNNILIPFALLWAVFRTPLLWVAIYGFLAAAAILPLYGICRERFCESVNPFVICIIYLNYRYLQNVLLMNFSVEIFYPLFIFSCVYFAMRSKWVLYYSVLVLGLSVKEDSFIYFSALGLLVCFLPSQKRILHGVLTIMLSLGYLIFLLKVFIPLTGNDILKGDLENFSSQGESFTQLIARLFREPRGILRVLFGSLSKWKTYLNLLGRLAFLPLFSPSSMLILAPLFPLFYHATGRDEDFTDLRFHYAAAVIPFVFIAFVFGFSNIYRRLRERTKERFLGITSLVLLFLNVGHYTVPKIIYEDLQSVKWARSVPAPANVVTHGHLLPYLGYRENNYYFAEPFEITENRAHLKYSNADYYLIDFHVNPYPMDHAYLKKKLENLRRDFQYELISQDRDLRYLFRRRGEM